jgi:hypothetical protein
LPLVRSSGASNGLASCSIRSSILVLIGAAG